MKRNFAVILILLFAFPTLSTAEEPLRLDGNHWNDSPEVAKITFVVGFYAGLVQGFYFSSWDLMKKNLSTPCIDEVDKSFEHYYEPFSHTTYGQVKAGLDTFYSDYRNRRILFTNAIRVVVDSINGTPQADIDKMTEDYRRTDRQ